MANNHNMFENEFENGIEIQWTTIPNDIFDEEMNFDSPGEKLTYMTCLRYSFQIGKEARPSQKSLAAKVRVTDRSIRNYLKSLEEKGFLKKVGYHEEYGTVIWRVSIPQALRIEWAERNLERMKAKAGNDQPIEQPQPEPTPEPKEEIPYKEIMEYLNEKTGKNFSTKADTAHADNIKARFNQGYKADDFIKVIDNKTAEWMGTDMERHLVPGTLFAKKHFDNYLNQAPTKKTKKGQAFTKSQEADINYFHTMDDGRTFDLRIPEQKKYVNEFYQKQFKTREAQ